MAAPVDVARENAPGSPSPTGVGQPGWRRLADAASLRRALALAGLGLVADFDLLVGFHSAYTHSIGAAGLVFVAALLLLGRGRWIVAAGAAAAYFSHPLLDWLGEDTSVPLGVMLWWPFSTNYYHSGLDVFRSIQRRYWLPGFWSHNLASVALELALLLPLAAAAVFSRRATNGRGQR